MAIDGIMLSIIRRKLEFLKTAKVEKVYQPSKYDLILTMKQGGTQKLLFSCDPERARVQLTEKTTENPAQPPMFCMLMRKHLCGGKLKEIRQDGLERILYFDFDCINELGDNVVITLCCEVMGRYSNVILINQNGKIIDSMRRVDASTSAKRLVLPGITYEYPPKDNKRLNFLTADREDLKNVISENCATRELSKAIVASLEGVSPLVAREWAFYALSKQKALDNNLTSEQLGRLLFIIDDTKNRILNDNLEFCTLKNKDGVLKEFTFMNISQYGNIMIKAFYDDIFKMLDSFYASYDMSAIMKQRADDIFKILLSAVERTTKRISVQQEEIEDCAKKDDYKMSADLISSYLYMLKKGDACVYLDNFYKEGTPKEKIILDPRLTPSENAQKYYKEYRKAVTAEKILTERIEKGKQELEYLDTVLDTLTRAETESDLAQLRMELYEQGYIKKINRKVKPPKALAPMEFVSSDGFRILVGRNNKQNDKLTMKQSKKTDYWFHTHNIPGSHVIVSIENKEITDKTIEEAAQLAAYHSKARNSDKAAVDYCLVKYVKKPPESKPGMVIFSNYKTILVTPQQEIK
jgi:predicted ribosome quality control (RQC) complex YloA/Tae2 family protein